MNSNLASPVRIAPVVTRSDLKAFIDLPWMIYRDDPDWVPPLKRDVRSAFDPSKHPFHKHSEAQAFLAYRGNEVVGRICAIRNRNHEEFHDEPTGFFGWFETIDDRAVADALLHTVREWLKDRGLTTMRGPTSFSTNETSGIFVEGSDGPPVLMMAYNPPYYTTLLEGFGMKKAKDLFAWFIDANPPGEYLLRAEKLLNRRYDITVRTMDMSKFDDELATVRRLYNAAWERNWGFVPMTDPEIDHMAAELKHIVDPNFAYFVEDAEGEAFAFALALPDFNYVLKKLNGKLGPLGIAKALIFARRIKVMRVMILGLLPEWRGKGIDALLYARFLREGMKHGVTGGECSWILEDNEKMNAALERMGARLYRRYRLYEMST